MRALSLRLAGTPFLLRLGVSDVRLVGFQRTAAAAFALPAAERDAVFVQLARFEGIKNDRGERIRRTAADLARARGYVALASLAEAVTISADMQRLYHATAAVDPVALRDLRTELVTPLPPANIPERVERAARPDAIVVWCGDTHVRAAAVVVHALASFGLPIIVVADGSIPGAEDIATFFPCADGAAALARARVLVAASNDDPGEVLALARLGIPLAAAWANGAAQEYLHGVPMYRAWIERDVLPAVQSALAAPPPRASSLPAALPLFVPAPRRGPRIAARMRVIAGDPPSAQTSTALERQTYADIVRDGEIDDAPYATMIPNGAVPFPDHLARMIAVAERSGAARVVAPALIGTDDGYALQMDGFVLERRGTARVPLARLPIVTGMLAG